MHVFSPRTSNLVKGNNPHSLLSRPAVWLRLAGQSLGLQGEQWQDWGHNHKYWRRGWVNDHGEFG